MKISRKIFSFIMSFVVLTTVFAFTNVFSSKAFADDLPVHLYYTNKLYDNSETSYYVGYIAVKNLGYNQKVTVHYNSNSMGNTWNDIPASYVKTNPSDGYEIWSFQTPTCYEGAGPDNIQYAIKYEVNGQTYWDNNNGQNYFDDALGLSSLYVDNFSGYSKNDNKYISALIKSKKSSNSNTVKLRYSTDNWATYKDVDASLSSSDASYEYWNVNQAISPSTTKIQFAVCYEENGIEYWDNNWGDNYTYTY